ncbi:hypothetical protein LSUB1_G008480 [Lachnellula subtilissima]|uniref:Uncharacterized protein n=1 Tax=Lachnellula subtilissima TaxID=602034 RepID=A0A8H8U4I4_9HELO|nr:hypothetical protein LSUB1_G008480 [Lachnellula subtilissima]
MRQLRAEGIKPMLFGYAWIETAEREYTYLSISSTPGYTPFLKVFAPLFYRVLWLSGISEPREFASDEDEDIMMGSFSTLQLRPGASACISHLRAHGFRVWCYTAGDVSTVAAYFADAGIEMPVRNLLSCDMYGVGKPDKESYTPVLELLKKENGDGDGDGGRGGEEVEEGGRSFGSLQRICGMLARRENLGMFKMFKGAWCSRFFGEMDVMADSLLEMAKMVVVKAGS